MANARPQRVFQQTPEEPERDQRERPTIRPAFDVAQFARDSEKMRAEPISDDDFLYDSCCRIAAPQVPTASGETIRLSAIPSRTMPLCEVQELHLDHIAGFVLSQIDGSTDVDTLLDLVTLPREDVLSVLGELQENGVISFRSK